MQAFQLGPAPHRQLLHHVQHLRPLRGQGEGPQLVAAQAVAAGLELGGRVRPRPGPMLSPWTCLHPQ